MFEQLAIAQGGNMNLTTPGAAPERVGVVRTSSSMFTLLGAQPTLGRVFSADEDSPGKPLTVILSYGYWQRRFGGDPRALGQGLTLNGKGYEIVGVMKPDFSLGYEVMPTVGSVSQADLLVPLPMSPEQANSHGDENYNILARLKPRVTLKQAQAELDLAVRQLQQESPTNYPESRRFSFSIRPLLEQVVGDVRLALLVLLGAVGCVLLIACSNVANLLLAQAATREKEMAVRSALGAGRWRAIRQLLTESLLLAGAGGALGLLVAFWGLAGLRWLNPGNIPRLASISIDGRVLTFTLMVVLLTGILFGLAPALRSSAVSLVDTLKEGGRTFSGGQHRLRNLLVVAEIAMSMVLLICAGLLIRSFVRVQQVEPGFVPQNVLSMRLSVTGTAFSEETKRLAYFDQFWERVRGLPGVESVGGVSVLPLTGGISWGSVTIEGYDPAAGQNMIQADQRIATTGYFEAMKVPLIKGRFFSDQDTAQSMPVVIVDENMSRTYWPNGDAVGKRLKRGGAASKAPWMTVVGVVASVKQYALDSDSRVALYAPHRQAPTTTLSIVVRTTTDPVSLAGAVTAAARGIDPNVPIYDVKTMDQWFSESLARRRFAMLALSIFAGVAGLLAAVGIFGVMSYSVSQRTREIGIRVALGAPSREVLSLIIRQGMMLTGVGVAIGSVIAIAMTRLMASMLFGLSARDPLTFAAIVVLLGAVALAACFFPARKATRVDPMIALRCE